MQNALNLFFWIFEHHLSFQLYNLFYCMAMAPGHAHSWQYLWIQVDESVMKWEVFLFFSLLIYTLFNNNLIIHMVRLSYRIVCWNEFIRRQICFSGIFFISFASFGERTHTHTQLFITIEIFINVFYSTRAKTSKQIKSYVWRFWVSDRSYANSLFFCSTAKKKRHAIELWFFSFHDLI